MPVRAGVEAGGGEVSGSTLREACRADRHRGGGELVSPHPSRPRKYLRIEAILDRSRRPVRDLGHSLHVLKFWEVHPTVV